MERRPRARAARRGDQLSAARARQKQLIAEAEARIAADAERLEAESEQQRAALVRLREEIDARDAGAVAAGTAELETLRGRAAPRAARAQRALRRRERELRELIEREETDAMQRIQAGFADVERRQVEQLERILDARDDELLRRRDAAVRRRDQGVARGLRRRGSRASSTAPSQAFAREAQSVLAEQLAQVGDTGAQRLEQRLARSTPDSSASAPRRSPKLRAAARSRPSTSCGGASTSFAADTEAERAVLEARLRELATPDRRGARPATLRGCFGRRVPGQQTRAGFVYETTNGRQNRGRDDRDHRAERRASARRSRAGASTS